MLSTYLVGPFMKLVGHSEKMDAMDEYHIIRLTNHKKKKITVQKVVIIFITGMTESPYL